ncbi:hypothetical protein B9Z55_007818 [Caenorhabditis nigoni]|uniref:BTB domain-containing protein n=1 Tax=Caenorhabditis nigoni TaxID=1611254 RepID=A0A2G5VBI7_9PELO|nr:hypothetical protein B9Z55_007818 [Caenorhabditis nigoni]
MTVKEFSLKYEFKDVWKLREVQEVDFGKGKQYVESLEGEKHLLSPKEEHFGVKWDMTILRFNGCFLVYLAADCTENQGIHIDFTTKIFSKNKEKTHAESGKQVLREDVFADCIFDWKTLEDEYLNDGKLDVEIHVKITKMIIFPREESYVTLVADGRKFQVSKLILSSQSPHLANLFSRQDQESEQPEIELKGLNPQDLQYYLDGINLEDGIDEDTVEGILQIADMYETPLAIKKCEEFLIEKSKMELKRKLGLAGKYRMGELKKICLDQIKTKEDLRSVIPENPNEMDPEIMTEILKKNYCFYLIFFGIFVFFRYRFIY